MKLTFLGTGTSTGIPVLNCRCRTCTSDDAHDKRLRASALLQAGGKNILIDCGPDFRQQLLAHPVDRIDALLLTHDHYDHVGGIDDIRPYAYALNRHGRFPVYCSRQVGTDLRSRVPWCFQSNPYPGVPTFDLHEIADGRPFSIGRTEIMPVEVMHWKLPILGFRFGPLAYITDCKTISERSLRRLQGVDTLVINALRHEEHLSHLNLRQALDIIALLQPRRSYLTHIAHQMGRAAEVTLPEGVELAYDGLEIEI